MRGRKRYVLGIALGLVAISALYLAQSPVFASMLVSNVGYHELDRNIYIGRSFRESEKDEILANYAAAVARVSAAYGETIAEPKLIFAATAEQAKNLGLSPFPARSYLLPWGEYSVFGPEAGTADIIAHELVHSEIVTRLGYFAYRRTLPVWFHEGAAMQVDFRQGKVWSYIQQGVALPPLSAIATEDGFFSGDRALNYAAAKVEIESWLAARGNKGLYRFLTELRSAPDFESLYSAYGRND